MPTNHFRENRKRVQKVFEDENFITPLTKDDNPFIIEEKNESAKLKKLLIDNIPATDAIRPISYVLSAELEKKVFSNPPSCKTVEKIFLVFCSKKLYVILIEMKSFLRLDGDEGLTRGISKKIKDSISRLLLLFPTYIFDDTHNDYPIEFFSLIVYNKENITHTLPCIESVKNEDLVKIFTNNKSDNSMIIKESLGGDYRVRVYFLQNTSGSESEYTVNLTDVFCGDTEIQNAAMLSDKTLPDIRI